MAYKVTITKEQAIEMNKLVPIIYKDLNLNAKQLTTNIRKGKYEPMMDKDCSESQLQYYLYTFLGDDIEQ